MLKILFNKEFEKTVHHTDDVFSELFEKEWLTHDFVKELIKGIDNSDVLGGVCIDSPVLGQIPPDYLSGGCKSMIMLYEGALDEYDYHFNMEFMGRNCEEWLYKISQMRDLEICCTTHDNTFEGKEVSGISLNTGQEFHNWKEFCEMMLFDGKLKHRYEVKL